MYPYRDFIHLQLAHLGMEMTICVRWVIRIYPHKVSAQAMIYNPRMTTLNVILGKDQSVHVGQTLMAVRSLDLSSARDLKVLFCLHRDGPTQLSLPNGVLLQRLGSYLANGQNPTKETEIV